MHAPAHHNPLLTGPILPTLLRLALPNMAAMVATSLVAIAETSYVGALGTPAVTSPSANRVWPLSWSSRSRTVKSSQRAGVKLSRLTMSEAWVESPLFGSWFWSMCSW